MSDDKNLPVKTIDTTPMISAEAYSHIGRYAGAIVMTVFESMGGAQRMSNWADSNPTDFYTKIFPKMISRSQQVDVTGMLTIDDTITRMEQQMIEGDYTEVQTQQYDL